MSWSNRFICYPVAFASDPLRFAITAWRMNIPIPVVGALDSLDLEKLSLEEPKVKLHRDYIKRQAKKRRRDAPFLGALEPAGSSESAFSNRASVSKNRNCRQSRVNKVTRYSTVQNSSKPIHVTPDLPKFGQLADGSTLRSPNTLPAGQSSTTSIEEEKQIPYNKSSKNSLNRDEIVLLPAPPPTSAYLSLASISTILLPTPQRLLLVLDLNGTLIYRLRGSTGYESRPRLSQFLDYCFANHTVLLWSSAKPHNVNRICLQLFRKKQLDMLLGAWARDTLSLTPQQYSSRVQVYKRLDRIWDDPTFALKHPEAHFKARWSQENTLLIDDSMIKASAQPYNLVQTPEFTGNSQEKKRKGPNDVLAQVTAYLEEARKWKNVSSFVRETKFVVDTDWLWDWKNQKRVFQTTASDNEEGGVKLGS